MHLNLQTTPFERDGAAGVLGAAWIDPVKLAQATPAQRAAQVALLHTFRPDCLLWGDAGQDGVNLTRAAAFSRETELPVVVAADLADPADPAPPGLIFAGAGRPLPFPPGVCPAEAEGAAACAPEAWIVAWARQIAAGAPTWATQLFATPPDALDHRPAERFARIAHRLQSFTRNHGSLLVRSQPLAAPTGYSVVAQPARVELTLRQLADRPVVTVFAINPSPHAVDGRLVLAVPVLGREVDLGRLLIPAGRFAVLQVTRDRERRTRQGQGQGQGQGQAKPTHERKKGRSKADHAREVDLLNTGIRLQTLFRAAQV